MSNWAVKKRVILDIGFPDLNSSEDEYVIEMADKKGLKRDSCKVFVYHHHRASPKTYWSLHKRYAYNQAKMEYSQGNTSNIKRGILMLLLIPFFYLIYLAVIYQNRSILYGLMKNYNLLSAFIGSILYFMAVFARIDGRLTFWNDIKNIKNIKNEK